MCGDLMAREADLNTSGTSTTREKHKVGDGSGFLGAELRSTRAGRRSVANMSTTVSLRPLRHKENILSVGDSAHDASVHLWIVGDLSVLSPNDLSSGRNHTELADIDFEDGALCENSKGCVEGRLRVLLDADDGKLEGRLELWMGNVGLLVPKTRWPNETLELWRLAREGLVDECGLKETEDSDQQLENPVTHGDVAELELGCWRSVPL